MQFQTVLLNAGLLIAFCVPGFLLRKFKFFDNNSVKALVVLLVFAAQPAMVARSILNQKYNSSLGLNMLAALGFYCAIVLLLYFLSSSIFRTGEYKRALKLLIGQGNNQIFAASTVTVSTATTTNQAINTCTNSGVALEKCAESPVENHADNKHNSEKNAEKQRLKRAIDDNKIYRFAVMFGNNGYFGLPLIMLLFPGNDAMMLYASLCVIIFNILVWTVGVYILTGDKKYISIKKGLLAPVPITAAITLPLFFIRAAVIPQPVLDFLGSMGNMTTPLSMVIMGTRLAEIPTREIFSDWRNYVVSVLRLLIAPAMTFALLKLFGVTNPDLFNTLMIVSLVPSAVTTIVLAEKYQSDSYTAVKAVLLTTVLCIITMPILGSLLLI